MPTGIYERKPRANRKVITCSVCGDTRSVLPSYAERVTGEFCSKKCAGIARSLKVEFVCDHCGLGGARRRDHLREKNYCSPICSAAGRRKPDAKWRNPDQIKEYMRQYGESNRDRLNELSRNRAARYRDKKNENQRKRRSLGSRPRGMGREAWAALLDIFGGKCLKCETSERLEADHVLPVLLGGTNDLGNFQPLCRTCNAAKGATYADYRTSKHIAAVEQYKRAMVEAMFPAVKIVEV